MKIKVLRLLPLTLMLGMSMAMAQVNFTQTTTSDFMQGTGYNVNIANDYVTLQGKMTSANDWSATTNMPQTLKSHQIVAWHEFVYLVGGYNGTTEVNTVYRATQQTTGISGWTTLQALPVALRDMAVVASQTHLFVIGGRNADGVSDKIYQAALNDDGSIGDWEEASVSLPLPFWGMRAVMAMGNIYLIGGANIDDTNAASNKVYRLKLNAYGMIASIGTTTNLPAARNGHAVAVYGSQIFVMGGYDATHTAKKAVYAATINLNGNLGSWSSKTSLPNPVYNHDAVCTNGIIAIIGGHNGSLPVNNFYYADPNASTWTWTLSDIMLTERYTQGSAFTFGEKIFYSGGQNISNALNNSVRYMTMNCGNEMSPQAAFVSLPFDVGTPKTMQQLSYTLNYTASTTSYEVLYRLAGTNKVFGSWISAGSDLPAVINQDYSYIQYMFRFTANGSDNLSLDDVTLTLSGFTQLAGNLNDTFNFGIDGSPYIVTSDITFTAGVHQIEAGVVFQFMPNTSMTIGQACLFFNGTQANPILLTSLGNGNHWNGVHFQDASDSGVASVMTYTTIEYGGTGDYDANLYLYNTNTPAISNCSFNHADGYGVRLENSNPTLMNTTIDDNGKSGLYLHNSAPTCNVCTMSNNGEAGIWFNTTNFNAAFQSVTTTGNLYGLYSCTPDRSFTYEEAVLTFGNNDTDIAVQGGRIASDQTWNYYANGYVLLGGVEIHNYTYSQPKLTIMAGNTVKMKENCRLYIGSYSNYGGMLYAVGTASTPITFTAYNGEVGGWTGIEFQDGSDYNSSSSLRYCTIEKATTSVTCNNTNQPGIIHCTLQDAVDQNLYLNSSSINVEESTLKNARIGIWAQTSQPTLISDVIENMTEYCIYYNNPDYEATYYTCTLKDSRVGIRYATPNMHINNDNNVTFANNNCNFAVPGGTVSENRVWASSSYFIEGSLEIGRSGSETCTLTISPGCTLKFASGSQIRIGYNGWGQMKAEGTDTQPILFTSMNGESGSWSGVLFEGGSDDDPLHGIENSLKHCIVENAVDNFRAFGTTKPEVEDCIFRNASDRGAYLSGEYNRTMVRVTVENNGGYGIYVENSLIELYDSEISNNGNYAMYYNNIHYVSVLDATFTGNAVDGVAIAGGQMSESRTWNTHDYYIFGDVWVARGGEACRLTLSPGTALRFAEGKRMQISRHDYYSQNDYGELNAIGTASQPITFTSMNGEAGGWNGLYFHDWSDNLSGMESVLKYCIIEKGNDYNLHMSSTGQPAQIENCIFRDAVGDGVYLYSSGTPTLQSCKILNSGNYGLRLYNTSPTVKKTIIKDNGSYGLYLEGNSNPIVGGNYTNGCSIYRNNGGNGGYEVYQNGSANISMPYNFFGSMDSVYIDRELVFDKTEDNGKGRIDIKPNSWLPIGEESFNWSGHVYYNDNTSLPWANRTIAIKDFQGNELYSTTTNSNGYFNFSSLNLNVASKCEMPVALSNPPANSTDAMKVMQHYTHLVTLEGARLRAADVNSSCTVNGTDALLIQRRFIGSISTFPAGDVQVTDELFSYSGNNLESDLNVLLFGDVYGNNNPSRYGIQLLYEGQIMAENHQQLVIPVMMKNVSTLGAASLCFTYPEEYLEIDDVTFGTENGSFMYRAKEGRLNISWYDLSPIALEDDALLLNISVTTKDLSTLEEPIVFGLENDSELADGEGNAFTNAIIAIPAVVTETLGINDVMGHDFTLTMYPNPVKDKAILAYQLPSEGSVVITVFNAMGTQVVQLLDERQESGLHQVELNSSTLVAGVYYCRLTYGDVVKVIKMIVE
jgi:parallel beta-helix repeat protein